MGAPCPGLAEAGYLDSTEALSLPELPSSLLVLGAGAVGLELGQLFARFGVRVMILEGGPHVAGAEEPEIGSALTAYLGGEKIRVCTNVTIARVNRVGSEYRVQAEIDGKPETCVAEQLLVATGRRPDTADFGLAEAGVHTGARGEIVVDPHLQTTNPDVYAAGDLPSLSDDGGGTQAGGPYVPEGRVQALLSCGLTRSRTGVDSRKSENPGGGPGRRRIPALPPVDRDSGRSSRGMCRSRLTRTRP